MRTLAILALGLAACEGALDFDLEQPIPENTAPGNSTACLASDLLTTPFFQPFALNLDVIAATAAQDTGPAGRVELKSMGLSITATKRPGADVDNFDFLQKIEIFVESKKAGSALVRKKVAALDPVPKGQTEIAIVPVAGEDLLPYINEGANVTASVTATSPCDEESFNGKVVVRVMF